MSNVFDVSFTSTMGPAHEEGLSREVDNGYETVG
jgi:hypothetical protein